MHAAAPDALFTVDGGACREIPRDDCGALQTFLEANPEYYFTVGDAPPSPTEARDEFDQLPNAEWIHGRMWVVGLFDAQRRMVAMANVFTGLFAPDVSHIGLFIVATALHGTGTASTFYRGLEDWLRRQGAAWIRLGVVAGNTRGERFWARCGFHELRARDGIAMGQRVNTVRVLVKPLAGRSLDDYLARVPRDRPGAP